MRVLSFCVALATTVPVSAQVTLESSDHDLLRMTPGNTAPPGVDLPPAVGKREVAVCLGNGTRSEKGMDNRPGQAPRIIAAAGQTACARWEPTGHVAYFYKRTRAGWRPVLSYRLDLRNQSGAMFYLDWLRD